MAESYIEMVRCSADLSTHTVGSADAMISLLCLLRQWTEKA